jgi:hypothetical protein
MSASYRNEDLPKFGGNEVKPGEIRRLIDMELQNDSRLVVVVSYNRVDESALVALVSNLIEIATPRDILLPTALTSAPFDLSLLPDFLTLAWKQQLDSSPVFGSLEPADLEIWIKENQAPNLGELESRHTDRIFHCGAYTPEFGDHVWLFRGKEIDALNSLGHSFNFYDSFSRFNEIWRQDVSQIRLTDLISNNDFSFEEMDSLYSTDGYRYELV